MTQADTLLASFQRELVAVMDIGTRDQLKRLTSILPLLMICHLTSDQRLTLVLGMVVLLTEIVLRGLAWLTPDTPEEISPALITALWATNTFSTFAYYAPAIILAMQPSVPLLLAGFIWMFGVSVYITNTFTSVPYFNWSQVGPGFGAAGLALLAAERSGHAAGASWEWLLAGGVLMIYGSNTVQTLIMQKSTLVALRAARKEADARLAALENLTRQDSLTGLLNRRAFEDRLATMVQSRRGGGEVAVLLIDLDRFKPINDSYSHDAGDQVLTTLGERLIEAVGERGVAARFGGDEFAMAVANLRSPREARDFGAKLLTRLEEPIDYKGRLLRVGASIGIGMTGMGNNEVDAICGAADQAMYRAKTEATNKVVLYDSDNFAPRITLQDRARILDAFGTGEIGPHYQPKVDLRTGAVIGFEALARWEHPTRGLLLPSRFLPQIDELGLQGDFLNHMAQSVFADVTALLHEGLDPGQVSINVPEVTLATYSGRQDLDRLLARFARAKPHLTFEITEDVFITRAGDYIQESISHFRAQGVRISLDDFGTGFASFQHLRDLDFDELKIDTSFVAGLGVDSSAEVLVEGFLSIAKGLGVDVIAEGVETDAQRNRLIDLGARFGQGWRFGRAIPLEEVRVRLMLDQSGKSRATG